MHALQPLHFSGSEQIGPGCLTYLSSAQGRREMITVSGLHGFVKAGDEESAGKTVAVIGDSTFIHSGVTGLIPPRLHWLTEFFLHHVLAQLTDFGKQLFP